MKPFASNVVPAFRVSVEQDICLLEGLIFPCVVNVLHYFVLVPIYVLGFVIRGLRVVILSSPGQAYR